MADMMDAAEVWNQSYQLLLDQPLELTLREMACLSDIHATNIFGTMIVLTVSSESTRTVVEKKLHKALTSIFFAGYWSAYDLCCANRSAYFRAK